MVSQTHPPEYTPTFSFLTYSFPHDGVCHLQLNRPPANVLHTPFWTELLQALRYLENHLYPTKVRVLVISSNAPGPIFSAGNDLVELHVPSTTKQAFTNFWTTIATFLSSLYKSPLYTIAAIRGATPAAACTMALCCDYRIALHDTSMGLNEVKIGLAVPKFWARLLATTINNRSRAEQMLASGEMINAQEANALGLVNHLVTKGSPSQLHAQALRIAQQWAHQKDVKGRSETKLYMRQQFADMWSNDAIDEAHRAWGLLSQPTTIATLEAVMKRLSRKASAKM